jgi:hypothetical protein
MTYEEVLKHVREGKDDGEEYALEWIGVNSTDPAARGLVMAIFSARESEDDSGEDE